MKVDWNIARIIDEFDLKIELTKQDISELLSVGRLPKTCSFNEDKKLDIVITLNLEK